ncbi:MBL fold metallo-hydrolase [Streptomyces sp. NPDC048521]|uniref:MBL fold metallo-hydrolase n=1 Tax=Streptomyces sp. NPDC048521 TaxID=3365566 RepID=UPI0037236A73
MPSARVITAPSLTPGYDSLDARDTDRDGRGKPWHVAATVSLLREGDTIVVDPGLVEDRKLVLAPLADAGISPEQVTDVVFSHHHPDHTVTAALFPNTRPRRLGQPATAPGPVPVTLSPDQRPR